MSSTDFELAGATLTALPSGALWWQDARALVVADMHLGRSERIARRGGTLLPPYETTETLLRLASEISETEPRTVICLGDSFDDPHSAQALAETDRGFLTSLMAGRRWIWVAGNHDPVPPDLGGTPMDELSRGPLTFRHIAEPRAQAGEVSGHYHPKHGIQTRAGHISRPCFVHDGRRLILPAFGAYTGGMKCNDDALRQLLSDDAICILTGSRTRSVPLTTASPNSARA